MNCCDYNCDQGRNCPARSTVARIKSSTPKFSDVVPQPPPPPPFRTPTSFKIIDLGPDDDDCQPLTHDEALALVRTLLSWLLGVLALVGAVALAVSYSTEAHAQALWAFLQGLS